MNELQVIVRQEPGVITWNFEDLKIALQEQMERYGSVVYTDNSIKDAKADVAMLRKLKKAVEDKRKEIKNKCLEPYEVIEAQAKELTGLIDRPIAMIARQVDEYEENRKKERKREILEFMEKIFTPLPEDVKKKLTSATYQTRWENVTAKQAEWENTIEAAYNRTKADLDAIDAVGEYEEAATHVYAQTLDLSLALDKIKEMRLQKEMILEQQKREREAAEAAAKMATEKAAEEISIEDVPVVDEPAPAPEEEETGSDIPASAGQETVPEPEPESETDYHSDEEPVSSASADAASITIRMDYTDTKKVKMVLDYMKFVGIEYEVI